MQSQMELLQKHVLENVGEPKEARRVLRIEEGSHPSYLKAGGNQGWNSQKEEERKWYYQDWNEQNNSWRREESYEEYHTQSSDNPRSKGSSSDLKVDDFLSRILEKVEGSDDMLKEMKVDFSSLNNRVNSHADAIKQLEGQLSNF